MDIYTEKEREREIERERDRQTERERERERESETDRQTDRQRNLRLPMVEVTSVTADKHHAVDRRGAPQHLAARAMQPSPCLPPPPLVMACACSPLFGHPATVCS